MSKYIPNDFPDFPGSKPSPPKPPKSRKINFGKIKIPKWVSPFFNFVLFCVIFYCAFGFKIINGVVVLFTPIKGISWMFLLFSIKCYGWNKYDEGVKDGKKKILKKLKEKLYKDEK